VRGAIVSGSYHHAKRITEASSSYKMQGLRAVKRLKGTETNKSGVKIPIIEESIPTIAKILLMAKLLGCTIVAIPKQTPMRIIRDKIVPELQRSIGKPINKLIKGTIGTESPVKRLRIPSILGILLGCGGDEMAGFIFIVPKEIKDVCI
jgi:hypothetical protein